MLIDFFKPRTIAQCQNLDLNSDGFGFEKSVSVRFRFTNVGAGFGSDIAHLFRFGFG